MPVTCGLSSPEPTPIDDTGQVEGDDVGSQPRGERTGAEQEHADDEEPPSSHDVTGAAGRDEDDPEDESVTGDDELEPGGAGAQAVGDRRQDDI